MTIQKYKKFKVSLMRLAAAMTLLSLFLGTVNFGHAAAVLADPTTGGSSSSTTNDCGQQNGCLTDSSADPAMNCSQQKNDSCDLFKKYFNPTIDLLSALVGFAVVASIITGAIQYSASAGDPQKAAKAKGRITNAVIAFVAFIFLFAFLQWLIPGGLLNK